MPTAGGSVRSPLEQMLEVVTNADLYKQRISEHNQTKADAENALLALGEREAKLTERENAVSDRETVVAGREKAVDRLEHELASAQEAIKAKQAKWKALLPQIAELVKG